MGCDDISAQDKGKRVVPKKDGSTIVKNANNEDVAARVPTKWCVCIDYRRLNLATFSSSFNGSDAREACGSFFLLFFRWLLGVQSNSYPSGGPMQEHLHVPLWYVCVCPYAFWLV